jgi:hypothetical protein
LLRVPVDHRGELVRLATAGGQVWIDEQDGVRYGDADLLKAVLTERPESRGKSWKDEQAPKHKRRAPTKPAEGEPMAGVKSVFESLPPAGAAVILEAVRSSENTYKVWYAKLKKACPGAKLGSAEAFRMFVMGRRRKAKGQSMRPARTRAAPRGGPQKAEAPALAPKKPRRVVFKAEDVARAEASIASDKGRSAAELATIVVKIVTELSGLTQGERMRVAGAVEQLLKLAPGGPS